MSAISAQTASSLTTSLSGVLRIPNLISLDAPAIACLWQWLMFATFVDPDSRSAWWMGAEPVDRLAPLMLCITVWLIYVADRLLDCRRLDFTRRVSHRHRFAQRWSTLLWPLWGLALLTDIGLAILVRDRAIVLAGGGLLGVVLLYAWGVHWSDHFRSHLPKEWIVGCIFAIGVSLPTLRGRLGPAVILSTAMMAGLFILNCLCVARVQRSSDRQQNTSSAILLFPQLAQRLSLCAAAYVLLSLGVSWAELIPATVGVPIIFGGMGLSLLLWIMDRNPASATAEHWGHLADYVLLSPLVVLALPG